MGRRQGCPARPSGRSLEVAGNCHPRWMAITHPVVGTEPGLQVCSGCLLVGGLSVLNA